MIAFILAWAAGACMIFYLAIDRAVDAPIRNAAKRGEVVAEPFGTLHVLGAKLGANPDAAYHYVAFDLSAGGEAELRWRLPAAPYVSIAVYTPYLQHVESTDAPTALNRATLVAEPDGRLIVTLGRGRGPGNRLDVRGAPRGVLIVRVLGGDAGEPGELVRLA